MRKSRIGNKEMNTTCSYFEQTFSKLVKFAALLALHLVCFVLCDNILVSGEIFHPDSNFGHAIDWNSLAFVRSASISDGSSLPVPTNESRNGLPEGEVQIKSGDAADIATFPYLVSLQIKYVDNEWYHICGGSLVATDKVLTAAHCAHFVGTYDHKVVVGMSFISQGGEDEIPVANVVTHPKFNVSSNDFPFDVAVLTLQRNVTVSSNVKVGIMNDPANNKSYDSLETCHIVGWGKFNKDDYPDGLRSAQMKGITNNECRRFLRVFQFRGLEQYHKCTWQYPSTICQGDSGGPLVCDDTLVGVASWGVGNCTSCFPAVFSRVAYHFRWVNKQL